MKIDFNNVRKNAGEAYNQLVSMLNGERDGSGEITVFEDAISGPLFDLRDSLAAILCVYIPNDSDCQCVDMDLEVFEFDNN